MIVASDLGQAAARGQAARRVVTHDVVYALRHHALTEHEQALVHVQELREVYACNMNIYI